ncbi:MAG: hypothetical protein ACREPF_07260 [Rhodanobacteraceae bacterium]
MNAVRRQPKARHAHAKASLDRPQDWQSRGRAGAVRTAWIVGGLALAFFVAALVEGHRGKLYPSWEPEPARATVPVTSAARAITPVENQATAGRTASATHDTHSRQP